MLGRMQGAMKATVEQSAWEFGETLGRKLVGGEIGGGGETREGPVLETRQVSRSAVARSLLEVNHASADLVSAPLKKPPLPPG
jgi:hypothetical protein